MHSRLNLSLEEMQDLNSILAVRLENLQQELKLKQEINKKFHDKYYHEIELQEIKAKIISAKDELNIFLELIKEKK